MGCSATCLGQVLFILFFTSLALPSQPCHPKRRRDNADKAALLAFKAGVADTNNVLSNWNETVHVCKWNGVVCRQGRVAELALGRSSLLGTISPSLSNLSCLQYLDLSDNRFQGPVPAELGALSRLCVLVLNDNEIQDEIPNSFGMLRNLEYFNLARNKLQGRLPTSVFYNCTKLRVIDLSANFLHGPIPPHIGSHLRALQHLLLPWNSLTGGVPASLSNATGMITLDLPRNFLSGRLPSDVVARMPGLRMLFLSHNNLSSDEQNSNLAPFFNSISNLSHLVGLGLAGNDLGGKLPSTIGHHANLSFLFLQQNQIHGPIPPNISKLSNLTMLNMRDNLLSGAVPSELILLPKLERLWAFNNLLSGQFPSPPSAPVTMLGELDLSGNKISGNIPTSLCNLRQLRILQLSGNLLEGLIPASLGGLKLELLDLSHNRLTGEIPAEVASLSTICRHFNLSNNLLEGALPMELGKMDKAQAIDLSANKFSSTIPPSLRSCVEVELLNLSHNSLQGSIPESFSHLQSLGTLDVSSNFLSGEIPAVLQQCASLKQVNLSYNNLSGTPPQGLLLSSLLTFDSLKGNNFCGLEGFPRCTANKRSKAHAHKVLVLCTVSVLVLLMLTTVGVVIRTKFLRRAARPSSGGLRRSSPSLLPSHERIAYRELSEATGGFDKSRLIRSNGLGRVYRGTLGDGRSVAIKVLKPQASYSTKIFHRECQVLKRIRHRNLIRIITVCSLPDFKALVFPFMANGSLESHLYPAGERSDSTRLSLAERVNICSDVAEALAYLHHHAPVQVIHRDLKPSNVLLNDDMTAMVCDFGISKLVMTASRGNLTSESTTKSSSATFLIGSVGYIAPGCLLHQIFSEYGYGRNASTKGDVYSFGILVLELVTRKRPTDDMFENGLSLAKWVKNEYRSRLEMVIDPSLVQDLWNQSPVTRDMWVAACVELLEMGLRCTQEIPSTRPTMTDVAADLDRLKRYLGRETIANIASPHGVSTSTVTQ